MTSISIDADRRLPDANDPLASLDQLVESAEVGENGYDFLKEELGLLTNPFPSGGIATPNSESPPLRREITDRLVAFLRQSYISKSTQFMVIRGDYGTGKSHTLRFIEQVINTRMYRGEGSPRAIYIERPRLEAHELNRSIMRSLGYDSIRKYIWFAIRGQLAEEIISDSSEFKELRERLLAISVNGRKPTLRRDSGLFTSLGDSFENSIIGKVFNTEVIADYRSFITALERQNWKRDDVQSYLVHLLLDATGGDRSTELAQAFVALLLSRDEKGFTSWEAILGATNSKVLGSLTPPTFLQFLIQIMKLNGIPYIYLLLDEFEEVPQGFLLTARQRQDYLYTIREVFNKIQVGVGIIIAISPGGWDALSAMGTPLQDVASNIADLPRLDVQDALKIAHYYLDHAGHAEKRIVGDLTPFSVDAIQFIVDNFPPGVQRTPRNLIQFYNLVTTEAGLRGVREISNDLSRILLDQFASMKVSGNHKGRRSVSNDVA